MPLIRMVRRARRRAPAPEAASDPDRQRSPATDASVAGTDLSGHIETVGAGRVGGWAASRADPDTPIGIRLYLDERLCAEGVAATRRTDAAGAEGCAVARSFAFPVPETALICAERLCLAAVAADGSETVCCTKLLRQPAKRRPPALWMDASDLVAALGAHREISGFHRLQAGYLLGLGNATIGFTEVRICARPPGTCFHRDVPYERIALLLREAADPGLVPAAAWTARMRAFRDGLDIRADLRPGDTLLTLGSPGTGDDHAVAIRCATRHDGVRHVPLILDVPPLFSPEAGPPDPRLVRGLAATLREADHVLTVSGRARENLVGMFERLDRPAPEIGALPTDIDIAAEGTGDPLGTLRRLGIAGPYVLCPGTLEPRANQALLLQVWRRLVARHAPETVPILVLAGRIGPYMADTMRHLNDTGSAAGRVRHLEGLTGAEMADLYDGCLFTATFSLDEGWPLPIAASLARGKVCLRSAGTSAADAGGGYALTVDPFDSVAALALCERLVFGTGALAEEERRLAGFTALTWSEVADDLQARFAALLPRLARLPEVAPHARIALGRTYRFGRARTFATDPVEALRDAFDREDAHDLLVGWHWFAPEQDCVRACGDEAALDLALPEEPGLLDVTLWLAVPPSCDGRRLSVALDGRIVGAGRIAAGPLVLVVPVRGGAGPQRLTLTLDGRRSPDADGRLLGLGIQAVAVHGREADGAKLVQPGSIRVAGPAETTPADLADQ